MNILFLVGVVFLVVLSVFDIFSYRKKDGYIPACLTTFFILVGFVWVGGINAVYMGLLGLLIGLLMVDFKLFDGLADLKVIVGCAIILSHPLNFFCMAIVTLFLACLLKVLVRELAKAEMLSERHTIPFIPVIALAYIITYIAGVGIL